MSHSLSDPERSWDFGLDDDDYVAFVVCRRVGERPIDWHADELVQYVLVRDLRVAQAGDQAILMRPKGAEEGFESRVIWPAAIAHAPGVIVSVTPERLRYKRLSDNRTISLSLTKRDLTLTPMAIAGQSVSADQIVGAVIPVLREFTCDQRASDKGYLQLLASPALSKRYAAAKALSFFASDIVIRALNQKLSETDEHIYVRLEAAASLARQGDETGIIFIMTCLTDEYPQHRLEAVIVLGEIGTEAANQLLINTLLDNQQYSEIRAGAAWALGEVRHKSAMDALIDSFVAVDEEIRTEAVRALAKLASQFGPDVVHQLRQSPVAKRPGIAWALSKSGRFTLQEMIDALVDEDTRHWVTYVLGTQDQKRFIHEIESLKTKDPEVYFAVNVLWKIMTSWIYGLEEY